VNDAAGLTSVGSGKVAEIIAGLVDGREGELVGSDGGLNKVEDFVYRLQRVIKVGRVVPPVQMTESLSDIEPVDTT
jgi:hypothetical protein